ncbi:styrene monooxygenase/indole monooxygenase family protein [Pseudonocardia acaciae]|uniref:styrene monooxygenase/indole monooxygenase family protein n=1 Tax=Pseudonocardia acaciae TaxID=551276 RepID=UPI00068847A0|nr:styrene monooxygenase/indole monooxygenase family protein [Pseudonocardia acaciae]
MARSVGIIGAGQAGIVLGAELLRRGFAVTLYSDRTPEDYLADRGRPTACLFGEQVVHERELGLNFWEGTAPSIERIHLDLCAPDKLILFSVIASPRLPALAVDQRLKFSRGLRELAARGASVVVEKVSVERLDALAAEHDLAVVTVGHGGGPSLFARDPARSVLDRPRRNVFMVNIRDYDLAAGVGHKQLKFSFVPGVVEMFWVPFLDKDAGVCLSIVLEAVPGGAADRFTAVESADQGVDVLRGLVRDLLPWEARFLAPASATSPVTWLTGAITPTVRDPVARLPSGRHVLGLGDAVILNDPLAGQGANNATRMARFFAERLEERGDEAFGADWLASTFDQFWAYGRFVNLFSNAMLEPLAGFQRELLLAASRHPDIGTAFFDGFGDPTALFPWFAEPGAARAFLREHGVRGSDLLRYKLGVARKVIGHKIASGAAYSRA